MNELKSESQHKVSELIECIEEHGWTPALDSLYGGELREAGVDTSGDVGEQLFDILLVSLSSEGLSEEDSEKVSKEVKHDLLKVSSSLKSRNTKYTKDHPDRIKQWGWEATFGVDLDDGDDLYAMDGAWDKNAPYSGEISEDVFFSFAFGFPELAEKEFTKLGWKSVMKKKKKFLRKTREIKTSMMEKKIDGITVKLSTYDGDNDSISVGYLITQGIEFS